MLNADPVLSSKLAQLSLRDGPLSEDEPPLSLRGQKNAEFANPKMASIVKVFQNLYDSNTNPEGIVNLGVADNSLCRQELVEYFNNQRLSLEPRDLTYADNLTASKRVMRAIADLFNEVPNDFPESSLSPLPFTKIEPEHIAIGPGAGGVLDELFWILCNPDEGVLLSTPYYNAFDHDLTARAGCQIVPVSVPLPSAKVGHDDESWSVSSLNQMVSAETVAAYERALLDAQRRGIKVTVLLLCNSQNPIGVIYPRETIVALAQLAAKYHLHFVSDEIYARSCYRTLDIPHPTVFHSVLSIDTLKEAGLSRAYVHVVTSASKDFAINGFRLGILISQQNKPLHRAMMGLGILAQSASPAANLFVNWLQDSTFLHWYLLENRNRMTKANNYVTDWMKHYSIPYIPASSGHFFLIDLSRFLQDNEGVVEKQGEEPLFQDETQLVDKMIENKVFCTPGSMYHHPKPGWFRITFTLDPKGLKAGLSRLEQTFGFTDGFEQTRSF